jgi:hypothetical protein
MKKQNVTFKFDFKEISEDSSKMKKLTLDYNGQEKFTVQAPYYYSTISHLDIKVNYFSTVTTALSFE